MAIIEFPGPAALTDDGGIAYRAIVDGVTVSCRFTAECLQDVNPVLRNASPFEQVEASSHKLLGIAEAKIRAGEVVDGVVWVLTRDL